MKIANLSFKMTNERKKGKTIVVPPTHANGSLTLADQFDLEKNPDEYMLYGQAYIGGKEVEIQI